MAMSDLRPEMTIRQALRSRKPIAVLCSVALLLIILIYFSSRGPHYSVIPAFDLSAWSLRSGGSLFIKSTDDGTSDLLVLNLSPVMESNNAVSEDWSWVIARRLTDPPPLLRYVASENKLKEVPLEVWDASTGKVGSALARPAPLTNSGVFTHDLLTHLLQFNGKVVPTAGPTVLEAQPDPSETYVAVLSAAGKFRKSWMPFGDPTVRGDRYHQLFRMSDGTTVGDPLKLRVATNGDDVYPVWSPDGRYVVYKELAKRLWIIDVTKTLSAGETE